ncbi:MAG: NADH-quinone oxidoreductase subunit N [Chloroflexi bacterium]|nr:NADH-quinone oxidoreductase subunit N [Chloroflexota bacterium]
MPELSLAAFAIIVILLDLFIEKKVVLAVVSIIGLVVAAFFTVALWGIQPGTIFGGLVAIDNFALFFKLLFLSITGLVILASADYVSKFSRFRGEYYALLLISTLGMMLMAAATDLISVYIALELTSIPLYVLVGFLKDPKSSESSLKYLLLGAVASSVLLFGMAFVFGFTGKTHLSQIASAIQSASLPMASAGPGLIFGMILIIAGFGFKIAAVPFQMWVPDVYEGAPTTITAFLSVGSKAAGFAVILRVFYSAFGMPQWLGMEWGIIFAVLAAISMTLGNILAIPQTNIKRMLGYSSIAQAGYLMVGLATVGVAPPADILGRSGILFFLAAYSLANLAVFIAIIAISNKINSDDIADFSGMIKRSPGLSLALSLGLISLIGMPPAAGFMAKFYIFSSAVNHGLLWLVIIAVVNSVASAYYYMRVVKTMWVGEPASLETVPSSPALKVALGISCIGVLVFGIAPGLGIRLAQLATDIFKF